MIDNERKLLEISEEIEYVYLSIVKLQTKLNEDPNYDIRLSFIINGKSRSIKLSNEEKLITLLQEELEILEKEYEKVLRECCLGKGFQLKKD